MNAVDSVKSLSQDEFQNAYYEPCRPVLIKGGALDWPAVQRWTPAFLAALFAGRMVPVSGSKRGLFDYVAGGEEGVTIQEMPFDQAAALICAENPSQMVYYLQQGSIPDRFPELRADLRIPTWIDRPELLGAVFLWFGAARSVTKLHYDMANNFLVQIRGRKRFVLFGPSQHRCLYPAEDTPHPNKSHVDLGRPDYARFPLLRQAQPVEVLVEPGDVLYVPPFWWHEVASLDMAISVNYWWKANIRQGLCSAGAFYLRSAYMQGVPVTHMMTPVDTRDFATPLAVAVYCWRQGYSSMAVLLGAAALEGHLRTLCAIRGVATEDMSTPANLRLLGDRLAGTAAHIEAHDLASWTHLVERALQAENGGLQPDEAGAMLAGVETFLAWNPA